MHITIFGAGYVGLTAAACFADAGHQVICVESDPERLDLLQAGQSPIYEPGMDEMLARNLAEGRLRFTADSAEGIHFGELLFIAVGTPPSADGSANLSHVMAVAQTIGQHMNAPRIIVNKSTVPVGTAEQVHACIARTLAERGVDIAFDVCSNPEFMKEGSALEDFTRGPRIIVGTTSSHVQQKMRECYAPYNRKHDKLIFMDPRSAELTKYAANAMLATRISFMNELANLAEALGADIEKVRQGIGSDPRIGYHFLYPGCGYGGSCFPKDVKALARTADEHGLPLRVIGAVEAANDAQKRRLADKIIARFGADLTGRCFALWGLAFKPNTDDMREAPSLALIDALLARGATVAAYDPVARDEAARVLAGRPGIRFADSMQDALNGADALAIVTEWKEFRSPDFADLKARLTTPAIFDGRNMYDPASVREAGLEYYAIGRP